MFQGNSPSSQRIPVTIITGFLGSGKTTLLNNIIRQHHGLRFAIIENEFGEMGIDGDLLDSVDGPMFELVNGCICCSLHNDFYKALQLIIENQSHIDHLLVEATGIADPLCVVDVFMANETISNHFVVDSVICVANANDIEEILDSESEARKQIAVADLVLLNKIDMVRRDHISTLRQLISGINPMTKILETTFAHTNGTPLLQTHAYSHRHVEATTLSFDNINLSLQDVASDVQGRLARAAHRHDIHAEGFVFDGCFDLEMFNIWMASYLYFNQQSLYRVKGILNFKGKRKKFVFQAVKGSYIFEEGNEWKEGETPFSKIVFIGKFLNRKELENNLCKLLQKR